jgi:hypothetical protein
LNGGRPVEIFVGFRGRYNIDASVPGLGPEIGVRGGVASETGFVRGGFFASARVELVMGHLTHPDFQFAGSLGGSLGPFLDVGPVVIRLPIAIQGAYTFDTGGTNHTLGLLTVGGEAGIRF